MKTKVAICKECLHNPPMPKESPCELTIGVEDILPTLCPYSTSGIRPFWREKQS